MITGIYLHDPFPFNRPFFMNPPFSESQKVVTLPLFPPPLPLLNFLSQVIFVFLLFWGMVMYANDIETNGKQKLPEIKKLISSLDFLCYSIRSTMSLELLSTIIGCTCVSVRIQKGWILIAFTSCKTSHNSLRWLGQFGGRVDEGWWG